MLAANPFGELDCYSDPYRDRGVVVAEGETLTLKYRITLHQGDARSARVAALWGNYAAEKLEPAPPALNPAPHSRLQQHDAFLFDPGEHLAVFFRAVVVPVFGGEGES